MSTKHSLNTKKITKIRARKLWEKGIVIYLQSCKLPFYSYMQLPCPIQKQINLSFDSQVDEFIHYNCDYERGYYPHFYIKMEDYNEQ